MCVIHVQLWSLHLFHTAGGSHVSYDLHFVFIDWTDAASVTYEARFLKAPAAHSQLKLTKSLLINGGYKSSFELILTI